MSEEFFSNPILNSPYEYPGRHWELDSNKQPTKKIVESRRRVDFVTPIPRPKKQKGQAEQEKLFHGLGEGAEVSGKNQEYAHADTINKIRTKVDLWRAVKDPNQWQVSPETARLLQHWRHHQFQGVRPFFCQVEAAETAIWLTEVAPHSKEGREILKHLETVNEEANPGILRLALKMATGSGKTTVMAMLIAWQTVNAVRRPNSKTFTRGFLVITPGLTIKDRLRVIDPSDPDNYYRNRELIPNDMIPDVERAKIVVTNYHAFKRRERIEVAAGTRAMLKGRGSEAKDIESLETEGQMIQRVMSPLMGMKNIMVINDEAHHCYRLNPKFSIAADLTDQAFVDLTGQDKTEAKKEAAKKNSAARLWISGIEAVSRALGVQKVIDLSATPFFLRGSGYAEGTLFPWVMSDFSLMDAIECGIVKLPRLPVADDIPEATVPIYRNLWDHIGKKMPKKGRGANQQLDPLSLPTELQSALDALYGHYKETYEVWKKAGIRVPPCFIVVCNNCATSKLVYDYISGFWQKNEDGTEKLVPGRLELFRNYDQHDEPFARPNTILIDSEQLDSGEALDDTFQNAATEEIEAFRRDIIKRSGDPHAAEKITDQQLLREVMNTVGKYGKLGESVRCVVSVSMLTEGWDTNTVTHILGVRAFGTPLLCEQVVGRALRRQSYDLNEDNKFNVEYADVLGIPFDFTAKPAIGSVTTPRETINVKAIHPERDKCEITFPRVQGYRVELPETHLSAKFDENSVLELTPDLVGPTRTLNEGIIGASVTLGLTHLDQVRRSTLLVELAKRLLYTKWRDADEVPKMSLFNQLHRITREWLETCLHCKGGTYPAQLLYQELADMACEKITQSITASLRGTMPIKAILDPYNPVGTTMYVNFNTSKESRWETNSNKCHVNWAILDSDWEGEFCRVAECHPKVLAYVKNQGMGFEIPYKYGSTSRMYRPDYIVLVDDGKGKEDPLQIVVEIKGLRGEDAKDKANTMNNFWVPGVNQLKSFGRWAFLEFQDVWEMENQFNFAVEAAFQKMLDVAIANTSTS
jgi:type III restriction enzyme